MDLLGFGLYTLTGLSSYSGNGDMEWSATTEVGETFLEDDSKTFTYPYGTLSSVTLLFQFIGVTGANITQPVFSYFAPGLPGTFNSFGPIIPGSDGVTGYEFGPDTRSVQFSQSSWVIQQGMLGWNTDRSSTCGYGLNIYGSKFLLESGGSQMIPAGQLTLTCYG